MIRTRVGYSGGEKKNPTYRRIGDHSETIQIDFDPNRISYEELLDIFWQGHNPRSQSWLGQYRHILFYHNEEQRRLSYDSVKRLEATLGADVRTEIKPFAEFHAAEDYHQKYRLQQDALLANEFKRIYPTFSDFTDSTAAARINGYLAGYGSPSLLAAELDSYGLSESAQQRLRTLIGLPDAGPVQTCPIPRAQ